MPRPRKPAKDSATGKRPIAQYTHDAETRVNNPPVGLVDSASDAPVSREKTYAYDPHLDPQLAWAGKAERTSFDVPTVSLHVHERIDPRSILEAVRKKNGSNYEQLSLWNSAGQNPPLRDAIEFYQHRHGWTNRLAAGDSLLFMNSVLEKEGMAGKVQMLYFDPPYGIRYGSNFQPFVNKRDVKDGRDEDLTAEPEMIKAFRDTWELGLHSYLSYLSYLRDRLLLARELLAESGSVFVQISDENVHHVREILDEVFGAGNFVSLITVVKTSAQEAEELPSVCDYVVWYARSRASHRYRKLWQPKEFTDPGVADYNCVQLSDGTRRRMTSDETRDWALLPFGAKAYTQDNIVSQRPPGDFPVEFEGETYRPITGYWKTGQSGMKNLIAAKRVEKRGRMLRYVRFYDDFPFRPTANFWSDARFSSRSEEKIFAVQTSATVIERCILMTTDPGDLVVDITCGSGTTAVVAEQWGRRWMTCDTSRVALTLAKQRLMTSVFDFYQLAHPEEGVGSGFIYKKVPHITLKSIANHEPPADETLYDQPLGDGKKARVCGPFTVEAVPAPVVAPIQSGGEQEQEQDKEKGGEPGAYLGRQGETLRQEEWRAELLRTGIRGKSGQYLMFSRVEPLPGTRWLHAEAETRPDDRGSARVREGKDDAAKRVVVSFGPAHAPLEQRQVEQALEEARNLVPKPQIVVFAAFQFDPEAAKDIDETRWPGLTLLKAQMNADMLTDDLKKKRASNDSFWMVGQPDVHLRQIQKGDDAGMWECEVLGFDYFNPKTGEIESGGPDRIAVWMLDTDYDGRSLFPRQVFFPMAGEKEGWARLAKNLRAEIDEEMIEAYRGSLSVPFELGKNRRVAVKIVDDRGIESLRIVPIEK